MQSSPYLVKALQQMEPTAAAPTATAPQVPFGFGGRPVKAQRGVGGGGGLAAMASPELLAAAGLPPTASFGFGSQPQKAPGGQGLMGAVQNLRAVPGNLGQAYQNVRNVPGQLRGLFGLGSSARGG